MHITFQEKLNQIVNKNNSLVCVGLDTSLDKIPSFLKSQKNSIFEFNKFIIDHTYDLVSAYKPNSAFYEAEGVSGIEQLKMTCDYLKKKYSRIPIILDAKRGDIGNTNEGYIRFAFDYLHADAITVHPYLGSEALQPFLDRKDKGIIILGRTSNPGSGEFQNLIVNKKPFYQVVAEKVVRKWNKNNNCLLVVGATYPEELQQVRKIVGEMIILVPGIGTQGGDIEKTVRFGLNTHKKGLIISASRSIIYASNGKDFAEKARVETIKLRDTINKYRT